MGKIEITIDGKAYPCRQTMGAMLRFKHETGKEVTEIKGDLSELCVFLWCCIVSACKADGIEFGMSLMDFADSVSPDDLSAWVESTSGKEERGEEKKRA